MGARRSRKSVMLRRTAQAGVLCGAIALLGVVSCGGATIFSPQFTSLLDPSGATSTIPNSPGHVVIAFVNNAEVDERLVSYLESTDGGNLQLTDAERAGLRPRMRLRMGVEFANGAFTSFEFISGSSKLIDQNFNAINFPDLNQNELENAVVLCDVATVGLIGGTAIEVFIPVEIDGFVQRQVETGQGAVQTVFELEEVQPPGFIPLEPDLVDADGNVVLQQNVGIRDVFAGVTDPGCGSVVAIVVTGTLRVPFLEGVSDDPSYDLGDVFSEAGIGGRFQFSTVVQ